MRKNEQEKGMSSKKWGLKKNGRRILEEGCWEEKERPDEERIGPPREKRGNPTFSEISHGERKRAGCLWEQKTGKKEDGKKKKKRGTIEDRRAKLEKGKKKHSIS